MRVLAKISDAIAKISNVVASVMVFGVAAVLLVQVIMRYVFHSGFVWSDIFARYITIWAVMLIANVLIKEDALITVDFFDNMWPEKMKQVRQVVYQFIFILLLLILIITGFHLVNANWTNNIVGVKIPWAWAYMAIPLGCCCMLYQYLYLMLKKILSSKEAKQ